MKPLLRWEWTQWIMLSIVIAQEQLFCDNFSNTGDSWETDNSVTFNVIGACDTPNRPCVQLDGRISGIRLKDAIDATNYHNLSITFDLDIESLNTDQDQVLLKLSDNDGSNYVTRQVFKTKGNYANLKVDFGSLYDGKSAIKVNFETDTTQTDERAFIDEVCIWGIPYTPQPTLGTTTSITTTTYPTTSEPTTYPTTTHPTTSEPTTYPTTIHPTTAHPTTTHPTTSEPTLGPITSIPTKIPTIPPSNNPSYSPTKTFQDTNEMGVTDAKTTSNELIGVSEDEKKETLLVLSDLHIAIIVVSIIIVLLSAIICMLYYLIVLKRKKTANQTTNIIPMESVASVETADIAEKDTELFTMDSDCVSAVSHGKTNGNLNDVYVNDNDHDDEDMYNIDPDKTNKITTQGEFDTVTDIGDNKNVTDDGNTPTMGE